MLTELADDVFAIEARFEDVPMQVYLIRGQRLTLIDPGPADVPRARLSPALATLGLRLEDVDLVLNTHGHHDHRGGNSVIRAANPQVRVAAHAADVEWIASTATYLDEQYLRYTPAWEPPIGFLERVDALCGDDGPVDEFLSDGDELDLGPGHTLTVKHVPAHTPGSTVFLHQQHKILFTGDALQARGTPLWKRPGFFPAYASLHAYRESLEFFDCCGAETIGTSHEGVCRPHEAAKLIADSRTIAEELAHFVYADLKRRKQTTLRGAVERVWREWPRYGGGAQMFMTVGAHLEGLVYDGLARRVAADDDVVFELDAPGDESA